MSIESSARPIFAAHQTFHPRFGWLKKGLDAVATNKSVFSAEDAPVILGVGKNMVEAIKFWSQAFRIIAQDEITSSSRSTNYCPTHFGIAMLSDEGFDPYLEDATSLWIMHWMLCSPISFAPVWWAFINEFNPTEFSDEILFEFIKSRIEASLWKTPSDSSLNKDVDALLRMYTRRAAKGRQTVDDLLDSPFRDLGLISESATKSGFYRINNGAKPTLTSAAVAFSAMDYMATFDPDARTISFTRLAFEINSPGRVFHIPIEVLSDYLNDSFLSECGIRVASPGGVQQLVLDEAPAQVALRILNEYFNRKPKETLKFVVAGPRARTSADAPILLEVLT